MKRDTEIIPSPYYVKNRRSDIVFWLLSNYQIISNVQFTQTHTAITAVNRLSCFIKGVRIIEKYHMLIFIILHARTCGLYKFISRYSFHCHKWLDLIINCQIKYFGKITSIQGNHAGPSKVENWISKYHTLNNQRIETVSPGKMTYHTS